MFRFSLGLVIERIASTHKRPWWIRSRPLILLRVFAAQGVPVRFSAAPCEDTSRLAGPKTEVHLHES